jgi:hypothetical protein
VRREPVAKGMRDGRRSVRRRSLAGRCKSMPFFATPAQLGQEFSALRYQVRLDGADSCA